ncbi:hypothetical protein [Bradyrhizobium sp. RT9a]|uniref:hypothetical protein n=1 Tax=Bradyrhizobium sp. RT9a TaxID=3156384 RepID=UPI00339703F9
MKTLFAVALWSVALCVNVCAQAQISGSLMVPQGQVPFPLNYTYAGQLPAAVGWNSANYPVKPSIIYSSGNAAVGSAGITPEALFDQFSTARSAPAATFWAAATGGSDGNNCLTSGTACATVGGAVTKCNTAAVPCKVFVTGAAGTNIFYKSAGFTNFNSVFPTVDIAFIATGGNRITMCHCDAYAAPSKDGTLTNTYSFALTNVERVLDLTRRDQYGNYVELTNVSANGIVNVTPNTWNITTGTIYIQRYDGAAVTNANTRILRATGGTNAGLNNATQTNLFIGNDTNLDGFDLEGGTDGIKTTFTTFVATLKAVVVSNASFKYAGGVVTTAGNCVSIRSLNGIAAFFNVQANACAADGFNGHNDIVLSGGTAVVSLLTVNSAAFDNGRGTSQSANCLTIHEDVTLMDIGGWCWGNRGGSVRNINSTKAYLLGTYVQFDLGDIVDGGTQPPTAFRVDNTSVLYADSVQMQMPAASFGFYATSTASIFLRNSPTGRQPFAGAGTFGPY